MYQWLVFAHVAGVFGFLMSHGVSAFVVFRVRAEQDIAALRALMEISARAVMASSLSLLVLVVGGVSAAFAGHWWGSAWLWAALGVFIVEWIAMAATTGPAMRRVRTALGFTGPTQITAAVKTEELAAALATVKPRLTALIGGVGLLVILWLMVLKPAF